MCKKWEKKGDSGQEEEEEEALIVWNVGATFTL